MPKPLYPMNRSIFLNPAVMPAGFRRVNEEFGLLMEGMEIREIGGSLMAAMAELSFTCRDLLGLYDHQMLELLSGLSGKSSEPTRTLAALAQMVRERPYVRDLAGRPDAIGIERLADVDMGFADAFAAYLTEFGCRALRYELAELTLEETPALVLKLLYDQVLRGYEPEAVAATLWEQRQAAIARARSLLVGRSREDAGRFEHAYPAREDSDFYTVSVPLALVRYTVLELGRRLADQGLIAPRDDVSFLELEEARAALGHGGDWRALVACRKAERAWMEAHPGPAYYGKDLGPPPSFASLPPEARFIHEAILEPRANLRAVRCRYSFSHGRPDQGHSRLTGNLHWTGQGGHG